MTDSALAGAWLWGWWTLALGGSRQGGVLGLALGRSRGCTGLQWPAGGRRWDGEEGWRDVLNWDPSLPGALEPPGAPRKGSAPTACFRGTGDVRQVGSGLRRGWSWGRWWAEQGRVGAQAWEGAQSPCFLRARPGCTTRFQSPGRLQGRAR